MSICLNNRVLKLFVFVIFKMVLCLGLVTAANAQPTFSKVFTPNAIGPGSVSTATFTITNGSATPVTSLAFTDTLPGAITIAGTPNASTSCELETGGSLSAPGGGGVIELSGGKVGGSGSCTVTVDVTASTVGPHTNPQVTLTSSAGSSPSVAVDLTVVNTLPGFSKSFSDADIPLGGRSTLTFTMDNSASASKIGSLDFTDNLPTGLEIADPNNASTDCISAGAPDTTLTANSGSSTIVLDADGSAIFPGFEVLPAGATCTVTVDVVATGIGFLDNISEDLLADFTTTGRASDTIEVTRETLHLIKEFTDDPISPGGNATLEFTIANFDRSDTITDVAFTDDLDANLAGLTYDSLVTNDCGGTVGGLGTTNINFSDGTVSAGSTCTISVSLSVPGGATPGTYSNATNTVTGTLGGGGLTGNVAGDDLFVASVPALTVEFLEVGTFNPDPVVNPGDDVVIRYSITNPSATSAAADLEFIDELTNGGPGTGFLPFPLAVTLPPVPDPPCGAGSTIGYVFPDVERQGLSLTGGNLVASPGPGNSCTFDVTVTIPNDMAAGVYTSTTEVITGTIDGGTRTSSPASDTLTVVAAPTLKKVFKGPGAPGGTVDLEFTLSHSANSPGDATDIAFTDDLAAALAGLTATPPPSPDPPCGAGSSLAGSVGDTFLTFSGGSLTPGEECTFSVTLNVPAGAGSGTYTNTTSNLGATVGGQAVTSTAASGDLTVAGLAFTKEFDDDPAIIPGDTTNLTFTIENVHPTTDATITFFTDNLQAELTGLAATGGPSVDTCGGGLSGTTSLTYVGGSVMSGSSCTIEVEVLAPGGSAAGDYRNITSALSADQGGAVTIDAAVDTLSVRDDWIGLTKEFTDDPVVPGETATLEFTLTNLHPGQAASGIGFTDDLNAALTDLTFDGVLLDTCGGNVTGAGTTSISVANVDLAAGGTCTIRTSVTVDGASSEGLYTNTTSGVTGTINGLAVIGDAASDELDVLPLLSFSKSFDGPTFASGTATLTFTITNPHTSGVSGLEFTDNLNDVLTGLAASSLPTLPCGAGSTITGVSLLTFSGGELEPGRTCSFDVDVLVPSNAASGVYPNTTSEISSGGLKRGDPATADLTLEEPPPTFTKAFSPSSITPGGTSTLTFTIDNTAGALAASSLDFTDNLPAGVTVAVPANASTTCTGGALTAAAGSTSIGYTGGTIGAGASCTVRADVTSTTVATHINTSGDLTSSSGNSGSASATLTVKQDLLNFVISGKATNKNSGDPIENVTISFSHNMDEVLTDNSGHYSFVIGEGETTTVTPSMTGFASWEPPNRVIENINQHITQDFVGAPEEFTIYGRVTDATTGNGIEGVNLHFSHDDSTTATDANGDYEYSVDYGVTTTVTPSIAGYENWNPPSADLGPLTENVTQNFEGTRVRRSISGQVIDAAGNNGIEGVTLTFSHNSGTTATNAAGEYTYAVDYGTTTTVTPSKAGYGNWNPPSRTFNDITEDQTQDFQGTVEKLTVSGKVTDNATPPNPVDGVTLSFSHDGGTTATDSGGEYSYEVDYGVSTTITPSKSGWGNWQPPNRTLNNITTDQSGQDFVGEEGVFKISGLVTGNEIPLEGATITYTGLESKAAVTTGSDGKYEFTVSGGTNTTLTPSHPAVSDVNQWTPQNRVLENVTSDQSDQNFAAVMDDLTLTVTKSGDGEGQVNSDPSGINCGQDCSESYPYNTEVVLSAVADSGSIFAGWSGGGCSGTDTCRVVLTDDISVTATFDPEEDQADLAITKETTTYNPTPGGTMSFILRVTNNGPDNTTGVAVTDLLPAGLIYTAHTPLGADYDPATGVWTVGDLDNGETVDLAIHTTFEATGVVTNTAEITATDTTDPDQANNIAAVAIDPQAETADLSIEKTAGSDSVEVGETLTYTLTVANNGPRRAEGVQVTDVIPSELADVEYLIQGESGGFTPWPDSDTLSLDALDALAARSIWIRSRVDSITAEGLLSNEADVESSIQDPVPGNNSSTAQTNVGESRNDSDLSIVKTAAPLTAGVGENTVITITVTNNGPDTAMDVKASDKLPNGLTYISDDGNGAYDPRSGMWEAGDFDSGDSKTLNITAQIDKESFISNTARIVRSDSRDENRANDSSAITINGESGPDVALWSSLTSLNGSSMVDDPLANGDRYEYVVYFENNSDITAGGFQVQVTLPNGLSVVESTPASGCYDLNSNIWHVDDPGACGSSLNDPGGYRNGFYSSLRLTLEVTNADIVVQAVLIATIIGYEDDPDYTNNSSVQVINQTDPFVLDLVVEVRADRSEVSDDQVLILTVRVRNTGPDAAGSVQLQIILPVELTLIGSYPLKGAFNSESGIWTVGNLGVFEPATLELLAKPAVSTENAMIEAAVVNVAETDVNPDNDSAQTAVTVFVTPGGGGGGGGGGGCFTGTVISR